MSAIFLRGRARRVGPSAPGLQSVVLELIRANVQNRRKQLRNWTNANDRTPLGLNQAVFPGGWKSTTTLPRRAMITLPRTNLSIFVLRKQSNASSGLQTTGSFSLNNVLSNIGM